MNRHVTFADLQSIFWIRNNDVSRPPTRDLPAATDTDAMATTRWNADSLDKTSRIIFPLAFIAFNIVYWPVYAIL